MIKKEKSLYSYAFATISVLTLVAVLVGGIVVSVANDVYAFVKPEAKMSIDIGEPMSVSEIAKKLEDYGIIKNPHVFILYVKLSGKAERIESFSGQITLSTDMNYREIVGNFLLINS